MLQLRERLRRFALTLGQKSIDSAFISPSRNFVYLTGLSIGHLAVKAPNDWLTGLLVTNDGRVLLSVPKMHESYARQVDFVDDFVVWSDAENARHFFKELIRHAETRTGRLGLDEDCRAKVVFAITETLPEVDLVNVTPELVRLRAAKDPDEIEIIRRASEIQEAALRHVIDDLQEGVSETELVGLIEARLRKDGADGPAFETIVRFGEHSSWLGPKPTQEPIRGTGPLQIDLGARVSDYCSDMTRTFYIGQAPSEFRRVYHAVLEAQASALRRIHPGARAEDVDGAARATLAEVSLTEFFPHRTGHGIGLDVQELPNLSKGSPIILREGMVVTVEPGVYLPSKFGVRIEDVVVVREGGPEFLTSFSRDLLEIDYRHC